MNVTSYIIGFLLTFGLHEAWFKSRLPVHVFQFLYHLGWKKGVEGFWPEDVHHWLRHEWEDWVALRFTNPWWMPIGELLVCPYCLCWHIAVAVAVLLRLGGVDTEILLCGVLSWPGLVLLLYRNA